MALDSETRWRLVRRAKSSKADLVTGEIVIRDARESDLPQVLDIYNYYVKNSVVTFDIEPLAYQDWLEKFQWLTSLKLPFVI
ncbi:MAG: hypothetical protein RL670_71, partial [Actinomycetota bacterium]